MDEPQALPKKRPSKKVGFQSVKNSFSANSTPKQSSELEMEVDFEDLPVAPERSLEDFSVEIKHVGASRRPSQDLTNPIKSNLKPKTKTVEIKDQKKAV